MIYLRNIKSQALYIDFEDERLTDFETRDFEVLKRKLSWN